MEDKGHVLLESRRNGGGCTVAICGGGRGGGFGFALATGTGAPAPGDGARSWGIFRDMENADKYVETFIVASWAEHLRQHDRLTLADREAEERVQRYVRSESKVRHLISVAPR